MRALSCHGHQLGNCLAIPNNGHGSPAQVGKSDVIVFNPKVMGGRCQVMESILRKERLQRMITLPSADVSPLKVRFQEYSRERLSRLTSAHEA
jgi:hypothetical protein